MGKITVNDVLEAFGVEPQKLPDMALDLAKTAAGAIKTKVDEETEKLKEFQASLENMTDDELRIYIPDVYQKDILHIDYDMLWDKGIRLISFDIDDTLNDIGITHAQNYIPGLEMTIPKAFVEKLAELKDKGFKVTLLTNAHESLAKGAFEFLNKRNAVDNYISRAGKPDTKNFEKMLAAYGLDKSQMAHVGNDIRKDVAGGNAAGVTTCLVRDFGVVRKIGKFFKKWVLGQRTKGHIVRAALKDRGLWRKHHKDDSHDQYYQLGETALYKQKRGQEQARPKKGN